MKFIVLISTFLFFTVIDGQEVWNAADNNVRLPSNAVFAGMQGSDRVYVGRIHHPYEGWIATKLVSKADGTECNYSFSGNEYTCSEFHYLTGNPGQYVWIPASNGDVTRCGLLPNRIFGVGRAQVNGNTVVGKIIRQVGTMFTSQFSAEHRFNTYEALARATC